MLANAIIRVFDNRFAPTIVLLFYLTLYLLFPAAFSTTDGWNYAAEIKHSGDLVYPFHLLYNLLGYIFCYLPVKAGADTLSCLKLMNSLFAVWAVYVVQVIIRRTINRQAMTVLISCLAGASFSLMRYAAENETYIIPLFFGLAALNSFISFHRHGKISSAAAASVWASLSVLFHASYICWWTGLMAGFIIRKNARAFLLSILISLVVPAAYLLTAFISEGNLQYQALHDFFLRDMGGNITFGVTGKGILFTLINIVRSFVQVHGYMFAMVRNNLTFVLPALMSVILFLLSLTVFPGRGKGFSTITVVILIILVLNLLLALLSSGNAEFMVMLPVLVFIIVSDLTKSPEKFLLFILSSMLLWNISYGLIPQGINDGKQEEYLVSRDLAGENTIIIASDDQLIKSMIYYETGIKDRGSVLMPPARMKMAGLTPGVLEAKIDSALAAGCEVLTDCIERKPVSRLSLTEGSENRRFFAKYESIQVFSAETIKGGKSVSVIKRKREMDSTGSF